MPILRLTPLFGILAILVAIPLQYIQVESVQPTGLAKINFPFYPLALVLQVFGFALVIFGLLFNISPTKLMEIRRAVSSSVLVATGAALLVLSGLGIWFNYGYEWGKYSCSEPQPYPVCGSINWLVVDLSVLALIGSALVLAGLYFRNLGKKPSRGAVPT